MGWWLDFKKDIIENANDYERNAQCDTKTTNGKYFGYLANGLSNEVK